MLIHVLYATLLPFDCLSASRDGCCEGSGLVIFGSHRFLVGEGEVGSPNEMRQIVRHAAEVDGGWRTSVAYP